MSHIYISKQQTHQWSVEKHALFRHLLIFIGRQQLVADAMRELGLNLDAVGQHGSLAWGWQADVSPEARQTWLDGLRACEPLSPLVHMPPQRVAQRGVWFDSTGAVWNYYLHGCGCRLEHQTSGEPLDWDCPDVDTFDPYFFEEYVAWLVRQSDGDRGMDALRQVLAQQGGEGVIALIEEMCIDGAIAQRETVMGPTYYVVGEKTCAAR